MRRELFVYWHVAPSALSEAAGAVTVWQRALQDANPGLVARLYRRADLAHDSATLMETYACSGGLDDALCAALAEEGDRATVPWRVGARHVEVFEPLG